jgi:hypothetical protein
MTGNSRPRLQKTTRFFVWTLLNSFITYHSICEVRHDLLCVPRLSSNNRGRESFVFNELQLNHGSGVEHDTSPAKLSSLARPGLVTTCKRR